MATELVDASKLDACCTAEANAIRAKTGSSAQIAFDWSNSKGFADAIAAIPSGGSYPDYTDILDRSFSGAFIDNHLTSTGRNTFSYCRDITSIRCMALTHLAIACFSECNHITTAVLPVAEEIGQQAFNNCSRMTACDFKGSSASGIVSQAFAGCSVLTTLVIRGSNVCKLGNIAAFTNSPFASGNAGGTLYVPSSLVSQYTQASNWATILGYTNNQIAAIEGSQYENYYADGTPIT